MNSARASAQTLQKRVWFNARSLQEFYTAFCLYRRIDAFLLFIFYSTHLAKRRGSGKPAPKANAKPYLTQCDGEWFDF